MVLFIVSLASANTPHAQRKGQGWAYLREKWISAKSYDFDKSGNETTINYYKMLKIIKDSGYKGYIGIEYEGTRLSEDEGIKATKALLNTTINDLYSTEY